MSFFVPPLPHFEELIPQTIDTHGLIKLNKVLADIYDYAAAVLHVSLEMHEAENDIEWYYDMRSTIQNMYSIAGALEKVLQKVPEITEESPVFVNYGAVCEIVVELEKSALELRKRCDLAADFHDLCHNVIGSMQAEIERCTDAYRRIQKLAENSTPPDHDWTELCNHMGGSSSLPPFSPKDETLFREIQQLGALLDPFDISLDIIGQKVEEFSRSCQSQQITEVLLDKFNSVQKIYNSLAKDLVEYSKNWLEQKWAHVVAYMLDQVCERIENEADLRMVSDAIRHVNTRLQHIDSPALVDKYKHAITLWDEKVNDDKVPAPPKSVSYVGKYCPVAQNSQRKTMYMANLSPVQAQSRTSISLKDIKEKENGSLKENSSLKETIRKNALQALQGERRLSIRDSSQPYDAKTPRSDPADSSHPHRLSFVPVFGIREQAKRPRTPDLDRTSGACILRQLTFPRKKSQIPTISPNYYSVPPVKQMGGTTRIPRMPARRASDIWDSLMDDSLDYTLSPHTSPMEDDKRVSIDLQAVLG